jgi:hypothetical protein
MSEKFVKLYDTVQISPKSIERFGASLRDDYAPVAGQPLRVSIVATHAGRITRNHGFYLPQKMRNGVESLIEPYKKPILLHHDEHQDPIGRVVNAQYIDTSSTFAQNTVQASLITELNNNKTPFIRMLDFADQMIENELLQDPAYPGLGHIKVIADITDEAAIKKILDKRYLTVSIGATTNKAVCSICKSNWVEEGRCEHTPGKKYKDKLCIMIAGNLLYDEVSFVNAPADTLARVVAVGTSSGVFDSVVSADGKPIEVSANFSFQDGAFQDILSAIGGNEMDKLKEAWDKVLEVASDEKADKENRTKVLKDFLETFKDAEKNPYKEEAETILTKLIEVEPALLEPAVGDDVINANDDNAVQDAVIVEDTVVDGLIEADLAVATEHYEDMIKFGYALSLFDEDFEDKKLTPEAREKLKKGTFCKTGRKYPVNDCSHAKVAMTYAKKHNEASSVVACIRRKAKALGCPFGGKDCMETEIDVILEDLKQREIKAKAASSAVQDDGTEKIKPVVTVVEPQVDIEEDTCDECQKYADQLKALRAELRDVYNEAAEDEELFTNALSDTRVALADAVTRLSMIANKELKDFDKQVQEKSEMKIEDLLAQANSIRESVDLKAVVEKLDDGMSRVPAEVIVDPTGGDEASTDPMPVIKDANDRFSRIRAAYKSKFHKDPGEADAYINKLRNEGIIPDGFDPNTTKEESV